MARLLVRFLALVILGGAFRPVVAQVDSVAVPPDSAVTDTTVAGSDVSIESGNSAEVDAEPMAIPVGANWKRGEERIIEISQGKRHFSDGDLLSADSSTMRYRVVVEEAKEEYHLVRWIPSAYESTRTFDEVTNAVDAALAGQLEEEGYLIRTNGWGEFVALENAETVTALAQSVLDAVVESEAGPEDLEQVQAFMKQLGGADFAVQKMIEPITFYYFLHGYEWPTTPQQYREELPLPGGSGTVVGQGSLKATDVNEEAGTFRLTNRLVAHPESLREGIIDILALAGRPREEVAREMEGLAFEMRDENVFVVDYYNGWVLSLDRMRIVEAVGERREQYIVIHMLDE